MQLQPSLRLTPSPMVDQVWHEHILFTKEYRKFCKKHFGSYVNHAPTVEGYSKASASDDQHSYAVTLYLYERYLKVVPSTTFWPVDDNTKLAVDKLKTSGFLSENNSSNGGGGGGGCGSCGGCGACGGGC